MTQTVWPKKLKKKQKKTFVMPPCECLKVKRYKERREGERKSYTIFFLSKKKVNWTWLPLYCMDGFKHDDDDDDNGCHFYPLVTVAKVVDRQTGSEKKRKTTFDNDVDINRVRSLTVWIFFSFVPPYRFSLSSIMTMKHSCFTRTRVWK